MKIVIKSKAKGYIAIHGVGVDPIVLTKEGETKVFETEGLYLPYTDHVASMVSAGLVTVFEEGKEPAPVKVTKEDSAESEKTPEEFKESVEAAPAAEESKSAKGKKK